MAFPIPFASKMSGASVGQLAYWRRTGVLQPEIEAESPPYLYSFRDIVALRTFAWLRGDHPLQMIRGSLNTLREFEMVEHPSSHQLVKLGSSIEFVKDDQVVDVAMEPGQVTIGTLADVFDAFETVNRRHVDPLLHPRNGVEVNPGRLGGWPTITGTRIPFDVVALLIDDGSVQPEEVNNFYPGVSAAEARDALDFQRSIRNEAA